MTKKSREEKKSVVGEKCVNHHGKVIFTRTSIYRLEEVEKTEKDRPERSIFNFKKETRKISMLVKYPDTEPTPFKDSKTPDDDISAMFASRFSNKMYSHNHHHPEEKDSLRKNPISLMLPC